jgi:hypothetical protein
MDVPAYHESATIWSVLEINEVYLLLLDIVMQSYRSAKGMLISTILFGIIFVVSPLYYFSGGKYEITTLVHSIVVAAPVLIYLAFRSNKKINIQEILDARYSAIILIIFGSILFTAFWVVDLSDIKISRYIARESGLGLRILNLHIPIFFVACAVAFSGVLRSRWMSIATVVLFLTISLFISIAEGRRAGVAIPVAILVFFFLYRRLVASHVVFVVLPSLIMLFSLMGLVTAVRVGGAESIFELFDLVLRRVFNPGFIALEVFHSSDLSFPASPLHDAFERAQYTLGISDQYDGVGNRFGRHYGLISADNLVVGINPGVIIELYLAFGVASYLVVLLLIEWARFLMKLSSSIIYGGEILVALLFIHGMQMEFGYTVGMLFKLTLALMVGKYVILSTRQLRILN